MRRLATLVLVSAGAACASVPIKKADVAPLLEADQRVLLGCYDCLVDARETYERVGVGKARPLVITRLFETQVLIVLREIELALDWQPSLQRARELAKELPTAQSATKTPATIVDGSHVLALVDLVPPDDYGWPSQAVAAFKRDRLKAIAGIGKEIEWLRTSGLAPATAEYLRLSIECQYATSLPVEPGQKPRPSSWRPGIAPDAPTLVKYRHAGCGLQTEPPFKAIRSEVPRFVDTSYWQGRLGVAQITRGGDIVATREHVDAFYARFPKSSSATYLRAWFNHQIGDCRAALPFYEETIALQPAHERALLGRVTCLSYAKQHEEAIAAATRMVELQTPNVDMALYWRAWNQRVLGRLPPARADIDIAKRRTVNGQIYTLAGMIEYDQEDLSPAEVDLKVARSLSDGSANCEAAWYLGLVYMKRAEWPRAAGEFEGVMGCYQDRQAENEGYKREIERRENIDAEFKARQLANFDAVIQESVSQRYAAAYNAAHFYARAGTVEKAKPLLEIAAKDSALAERVAELKKLIGGGGSDTIAAHGHLRALRNHARQLHR
jgi:hypothetical protein